MNIILFNAINTMLHIIGVICHVILQFKYFEICFMKPVKSPYVYHQCVSLDLAAASLLILKITHWLRFNVPFWHHCQCHCHSLRLLSIFPLAHLSTSPCLTHVSHTYFPFACNWPQYLGHRYTLLKWAQSWAHVCVCMCPGVSLPFPTGSGLLRSPSICAYE